MKKIACSVMALMMAFAMTGCGNNDELQKEIAALHAQIERQEDRITELENQNGALSDKLSEMEADNKLSFDKLTELETENEALSDKVKELETENEELKATFPSVSGNFYSLGGGYYKGWITRDDLLSVAYYAGAGDLNKKITGENFVPKKKNPETLSEEILQEIKEARVALYIDQFPDLTTDDVEILAYYGTYNGFVALLLGPLYGIREVPEGIVWSMDIDDVHLGAVNYDDELILWKV